MYSVHLGMIRKNIFKAWDIKLIMRYRSHCDALFFFGKVTKVDLSQSVGIFPTLYIRLNTLVLRFGTNPILGSCKFKGFRMHVVRTNCSSVLLQFNYKISKIIYLSMKQKFVYCYMILLNILK